MIEVAIKAVEGSGPGPALPTRARSLLKPQKTPDDQELDPARVPRDKKNEPRLAASSVGSAIFSTRITLDSKTLQVYVQTVSEHPNARVVHSYPPPPQTDDPKRLIVLA